MKTNKNNFIKKMKAVGISAILVCLIIVVLVPQATAVYVAPGNPENTSVSMGNTITFENVNLTIRGAERIPVNNLTFTVYNSTSDLSVGFVKFYIDGIEIEDNPSGKFAVTCLTETSSLPYGSGGSYYGFDEIEGTNHSFNYGYGYGDDA